MSARVTVLGLGNALKGDEGLGFYVIRDLAREAWPTDVCFVHKPEFEWEPLFFRECRGVLLLDTVCRGNEPGTVYIDGQGELQSRRDCLRNPFVLDAMAFSALFGAELDAEFVGMEPECRECRICLTSAVSCLYRDFLQTVRTRISEMLERIRAADSLDPAKSGETALIR